jgi:hypothetical protein
MVRRVSFVGGEFSHGFDKLTGCDCILEVQPDSVTPLFLQSSQPPSGSGFLGLCGAMATSCRPMADKGSSTMPLVVVTRDPKVLGDEQALRLGKLLQDVVADFLNAPADLGGELGPDEIEVRFRDIGPLDINASPLGIEIFAGDFPTRRINLEERVDRICRDLRTHPDVPDSVIDDKGGFVWVFLGQTAFEKL